MCLTVWNISEVYGSTSLNEMIVNLDNMHRTCTFVPHPVFKLELVSSKLLSFISSVHLVTKKDTYYCLFCVLWIEDYALMFL